MSILCHKWPEELKVLKWSPVQTYEGLTISIALRLIEEHSERSSGAHQLNPNSAGGH